MEYVNKLEGIRERLAVSREQTAKMRAGQLTPEEKADYEGRTQAQTEATRGAFETLKQRKQVDYRDDPRYRELLKEGVALFDENALVEIAINGQRHSYAHTEDDDEAFYLFKEFLNEYVEKHPEHAEATQMLAVSLDSPHGDPIYLGSAKWCHFGFNKVQYDAKYAASLACTTFSKSVLAQVRLPWPAFLIEVPKGFLPFGDGDELSLLLVTEWLQTKAWRVMAFSKKGNQRLQIAEGAAQLLGIEDEREGDLVLSTFQAKSEDRVLSLMSRLIVATCLALTDPTTHKVYQPINKKGPSLGSRFSKRKNSRPEVRIYEMGKPVKIDCRPIVLSYLAGEGTGKALSKQIYVGNYFRWQPYGPRNSLRRWQLIEGHWKGPEDAPIAVRSHVMMQGVDK